MPPQVITNQDLNNPNKNQQNQNQVQTNQSNQNPQQQQQSNNQIAQNYGGAPAPQQASNPNQQRGSGYTNIQRIVQANQANKLGSTIGQNIQNAAQNVRSNVGQAQQQFQQQAGANRADTAQNAALVQQALQDPTKFVNNQNQIGQFQNLIGGIYQGPQGLQNAQQLQAQAQDISQLGQAVGSAGGRQGLLQRFVGAPQYTAGQQTLDSLLLGATGAPALQQARRSTAGLLGQEQQAQQGATQTAQEYAKRAQQFGQNVQQQFGQNVAQQQQALTQQAQNAQQQRDAQIAALQQQLAQGNISPELAAQLGITQGQRTYNVTPETFVSENPLQANAQNIANAQQYAQMQALQKLGGQFAPSQAAQTLAQFQNPSQAGTFQASNAYNVNAPGFQQAQQQAQQAAQNAYQQYVSSNVNPAYEKYRNLALQAAISGTSGGRSLANQAYQAYQQALAQSQGILNPGGTFNVLPTEGQS